MIELDKLIFSNNFIFLFLSRETEGLARRCLSNQPSLGMVLIPIDANCLEDEKIDFKIFEGPLLTEGLLFFATLLSRVWLRLVRV